MNLRALKYRLRRWLRRRPRYFVATYGNMGLEIEFFRDKDEFDDACNKVERDHEDDRIDTYTHGEIE